MKRRGFTLIELSVIVLILAMFAAATVPNMASAIEGGKRRGFRQSILTMVRQGREEAITRGQVVYMESNSDGGFDLTTAIDDQSTSIKQVAAVDGVTVENFVSDTSPSAQGDWVMAFYPDGTCQGGSFEFQEAGDTRSVSISKRNAAITLGDGPIDTSTDPNQEWQAGDYERSG